jgi:hypothetical protein
MAGEWSVDVSGLTVHLVKLMGVAGKRQWSGHMILKLLVIGGVNPDPNSALSRRGVQKNRFPDLEPSLMIRRSVLTRTPGAAELTVQEMCNESCRG